MLHIDAHILITSSAEGNIVKVKVCNILNVFSLFIALSKWILTFATCFVCLHSDAVISDSLTHSLRVRRNWM